MGLYLPKPGTVGADGRTGQQDVKSVADHPLSTHGAQGSSHADEHAKHLLGP